jgi:hypothetical protein
MLVLVLVSGVQLSFCACFTRTNYKLLSLITTHRSNTVAFYYILQHVLAVQISHNQINVGYTK